MILNRWLQEFMPLRGLARKLKDDSFSWKNEITAALVGAVLVIPQGISFSYLVDVPVAHGLSCAVIVNFFAALFGNSIIMSGPNTATSILLGLSIVPLAEAGLASKVDLVLLLTFLVGCLQLLVWLSRTARVLDLLDDVAISAIVHGVGVLIIVSSLFSLFGIDSITGSMVEKVVQIYQQFDSQWSVYALAIGLVTIFVGIFSSRFSTRYYIYFALFAGGFTCWFLQLFFNNDLPIRFLSAVSPEFILPRGLVLVANLDIVMRLLPAAFSITLISLAHNLVIAKDLKLNVDKEINLNKEVFAVGIANVVAPFFQSFAGAGSFNRTQVHREMQAQTTLSTMTSALMALFLIILFGSFFSYVPDALIGGILFIVGLRMIRPVYMKDCMRSRWLGCVFFSVFLTVLFVGLVPAVALALFLSVIKKNHLGDYKK